MCKYNNLHCRSFKIFILRRIAIQQKCRIPREAHCYSTVDLYCRSGNMVETLKTEKE